MLQVFVKHSDKDLLDGWMLISLLALTDGADEDL